MLIILVLMVFNPKPSLVLVISEILNSLPLSSII